MYPTSSVLFLLCTKKIPTEMVFEIVFFAKLQLEMKSSTNNMWKIIFEFHMKNFYLGNSHLVYTQNFPRKKLFYPQIRMRMWMYQRLKNVSFSEIFVYVLIKWFIIIGCWISYLTFLNCLYFAFTRKCVFKFSSSFCKP